MDPRNGIEEGNWALALNMHRSVYAQAVPDKPISGQVGRLTSVCRALQAPQSSATQLPHFEDRLGRQIDSNNYSGETLCTGMQRPKGPVAKRFRRRRVRSVSDDGAYGVP